MPQLERTNRGLNEILSFLIDLLLASETSYGRIPSIIVILGTIP